MNTNKKTVRTLEDVKINVKMKLSALWATVMFCYLYCDYFSLHEPGHIEKIIEGKFGLFPTAQVTQVALFGAAILMAIPAVMIFLSLTLKPKANRWANIILGIIYTVVVLIFLLKVRLWAYFIFYGIVEVVLTALIVWYAWKWPKQEA